MSHNVTISDVKITDMEALAEAAKELAAETGSRMELVKGGTFRTWAGRGVSADYVLKMQDCSYDVGFKKNKDGSYTPIIESDAYQVRELLGAQANAETVEGEVRAGGRYGNVKTSLGKLQQRMNVIVAEREAARSGLTTTREYDERSGIFNVIAVGYT